MQIPGWRLGAANVILPTFSYVVFTVHTWVKRSDRKPSVLLPPKYKTKSQFRLRIIYIIFIYSFFQHSLNKIVMSVNKILFKTNCKWKTIKNKRFLNFNYYTVINKVISL